ncbi:hypothetical protein KSF_054910 [Reticulibacter mediterranei]|uniref:Uncharacterized protein n=1 Tax=Reticulibacter mediterranei TaxID=2778369 RepID=A0A8J3IN50_9CHLR|nr:hypothetical protein [Reticulibacter mediterranei]GHO95443.1 hypothetical protein KSF_054910 [Reticulibacter mediterranei]
MVERSVVFVQPVQVTGNVGRKGNGSCTDKLPIEVVALLDVFARIEVRRRAKLATEGKVV